MRKLISLILALILLLGMVPLGAGAVVIEATPQFDFSGVSATPIVHGQKLSESTLSGDVYITTQSMDLGADPISQKAEGNLAWENGDLVPDVGKHTYNVTFTDKDDPLVTTSGEVDNVIVKAKVTFDANGGTGTMDPDASTEEFSYTLPECKFTAPEGKEFRAWSVNSAEKAPGAEISGLTADLEVKALWQDKATPVAETCTIIFNANGGSGEMAKVEVEKGSDYVLPACAYNPPQDMEFDKWDLGEVGTTVKITDDTIISAQWKVSAEALTKLLDELRSGIKAEDKTVTYDKKKHSITVEASDPRVKITYAKQQKGIYRSEEIQCKNPGEYTIYFQATYDDMVIKSGSVTLKINKAKNPMTVSTYKINVSATKLEKGNRKYKAIKAKNKKGNVEFKKISGPRWISVNKQTGQITLKKGTYLHGTQHVKIQVKCLGNSIYLSKTVKCIVTVEIKND